MLQKKLCERCSFWYCIVWDCQLSFRGIKCLETPKIHVFQPQTDGPKLLPWLLTVTNLYRRWQTMWNLVYITGRGSEREGAQTSLSWKFPALQINVSDCLPTRWSGTKSSHWSLRTALPISTAREDIFNVEAPIQGRPIQLVAGGKAFEHTLIFVLYLGNEVGCILVLYTLYVCWKRAINSVHAVNLSECHFFCVFFKSFSLSLYP